MFSSSVFEMISAWQKQFIDAEMYIIRVYLPNSTQSAHIHTTQQWTQAFKCAYKCLYIKKSMCFLLLFAVMLFTKNTRINNNHRIHLLNRSHLLCCLDTIRKNRFSNKRMRENKIKNKNRSINCTFLSLSRCCPLI